MHSSKAIFGIATVAAVLFGTSGVADTSGLSLTIRSVAGPAIELSLDQLDDLRQVSFDTSTIWTASNSTFSGVPLSTVLSTGDIAGGEIQMTALNQYSVDMPVSEIGPDYPIVATRIDGEEIQVRDKGPFWIVYPYDNGPEYQTEVVYARSVWQLVEITALE